MVLKRVADAVLLANSCCRRLLVAVSLSSALGCVGEITGVVPLLLLLPLLLVLLLPLELELLLPPLLPPPPPQPARAMTITTAALQRINSELIEFPRKHRMAANVPPWSKPVRCRHLESLHNKNGHRSARRRSA
jgi:hypothetical protein